MIASNYRKFPEAMALQLVLHFGKCKWHAARPTQRSARAVRAARAALVRTTPQIVRWVAQQTPQWVKDAKRAANLLAREVKAACASLDWTSGNAQASELAKLLRGKAWPFNAQTRVFELVELYSDTHHGNQAKPLQWAMRRECIWAHIPSGTHLAGAMDSGAYDNGPRH